MQVYLMMAEHFNIPGLIVRICATRARAVDEALACVNIMLHDSGIRRPVHTEAGMLAAIERLQDKHGAQYCYADITEYEVQP